MKRKALMTLLFTLAALPAAAQDLGGMFAQPLGIVAQMSWEERQALRERWKDATPEERAQMRRAFQERLRMMSPEAYEPGHMDFRQGRRADRGMKDGRRLEPPDQDFGYGFGKGYEQRGFDGRFPMDDDHEYGRDGGGRRGGGRR